MPLCFFLILLTTGQVVSTYELRHHVHALQEGTGIIGGALADIRDYPFLVAIEVKNAKTYKPQCTGTLIAPNLILTAAHCFNGTYNTGATFRAVAGIANLQDEMLDDPNVEYAHTRLFQAKTVESEADFRRAKAQVYMHSDYDETKPEECVPQHDIALIKLRRPFEVNYDTTGLAVLPDDSVRPIDSEATALGWGDTSFSGDIGWELKQCPYKVQKCRSKRNDFICAATALGSMAQNKALRGDSGGPLLVPGNGGIIQVGVLSRGWNKEPPAEALIQDKYAMVSKQVVNDMLEEPVF